MKKIAFILISIVALVAVLPATVLAQGLDQTLEAPDIGFTMNYPAGWVELPMAEGYALSADPNFDPDGAAPPSQPALIILGLPAEFATMMGSSADVLDTFAGEFGADAADAEEIMVGGAEALRVSGAVPEDGYTADIVMIFGEYMLYIMVGAVPDGSGDFSATLTEMLDTVVLSEPTGTGMDFGMGGAPSDNADVPMVNGVRITVDQSITEAWNEIDAVSLIGADVDGFEVTQWAISAEATSQYGDDSWSASQATGSPDTTECGDITTAWASATSTGYDTLTLTYGAPVAASMVEIYQTYNPGAIVLVELLPADGSEAITIFEGVDATTECPGVFSISVGAGVAGSLVYGETVSSSISAMTYAQDWTFDGSAGDTVTITMISPDDTLDSYLYLYGPDGAELAYNDDADDPEIGFPNSQIPAFTLPADGTYTIRATRYGEDLGSSTGAYDLSLEMGDGAPATGGKPTGSAAGGGMITLGQTVTGSISDTAFEQDWTFDGSAGDIVTITMVDVSADGSLDTYLSLLDSSGIEVTYNDDGGSMDIGPLDSQILDFVLPADDTYTIRASRFGGDMGSGAGAYELTLEEGQASVPVGSLSYGETVSGTISDEEYRQDWTFEGSAGDIVTITMVDTTAAESLDTYLSLRDSSGIELDYNDDAADSTIGDYNSQIVRFPLPADGTYIIRASRFGEGLGMSFGTYDLTLAAGK
jgi:hypothetical protein